MRSRARLESTGVASGTGAISCASAIVIFSSSRSQIQMKRSVPISLSDFEQRIQQILTRSIVVGIQAPHKYPTEIALAQDVVGLDPRGEGVIVRKKTRLPAGALIQQIGDLGDVIAAAHPTLMVEFRLDVSSVIHAEGRVAAIETQIPQTLHAVELVSVERRP